MRPDDCSWDGERVEFIVFDVPGMAIRLNGEKVKQVDDVDDCAIDSRDPREAVEALISALVIEGRAGVGQEEWDADASQYLSLEDWSRLAPRLRWIPDAAVHSAPVDGESEGTPTWFARVKIDKHFHEYFSKAHNDEDGHAILGEDEHRPTSKITYMQLVHVVLEELGKNLVSGLVDTIEVSSPHAPRVGSPNSYSSQPLKVTRKDQVWARQNVRICPTDSLCPSKKFVEYGPHDAVPIGAHREFVIFLDESA
mmetsp:Transcript_9603/g.29080  ORF Transcript_9603/g.29080 Transcript_9603/m.29080 type:complete len:253 (-) Transcript_9603:1040-1798(-)